MKNVLLPSREGKSVLNNCRPTIGFLIESLSGSYQLGIWPGIVEVARAADVNLVCFTGGAYKKSPADPWEWKRNILYDLATQVSLDGLIISGSLCSYVSEAEIQEFFARFIHKPVVSLLPLSPTIPSVSVDNSCGLEALLTHLVDIHAYQRFAFIKGPEGNPESEERLSLFLSFLAQQNIPVFESDLFAGSFNRESGADAVEKMLKDTGKNIPYDAIVCADDETAYGVIEALREHNIAVPDHVVVVGFDNVAESTYITPPLTTVSQPLHELGARACELLIAKLAGREVPLENILEARLKVRQSCGCFEYQVHKTRIRKALIEAVSAQQKLDVHEIYVHVTDRLGQVFEAYSLEFGRLRDMVDTFCEDVNRRESSCFLMTVDRIGRENILAGSNLVRWNQFFSSLWYYCLSHLDRATFSYADSLLHQARIIRGDLVLRAQGYRRIQASREYTYLHESGETISNTIDTEKLIEVIAEELPSLGLTTFFVTCYEESENPLGMSRLALAVENGVRMGRESILFPTTDILPEGTVSSKNTHVLISEPLYFHNEIFGIIYFMVDHDEYDASIFEVLGTYISNALHAGYLIQKVQHQADVLQKQNQELEILREKEHQYLEGIRRELELGRKIQMTFLPSTIYQPEGYSISVAFKPAREVSGDFYDVLPLSDTAVGIIIADVSGKDVSAALFMSLLKTLLHVFAEAAHNEGRSPLDSIKAANEYVLKYHRQPRGRCMFATIVYGILNPQTGQFDYVNAGHNPVLIFSPKGELRARLKSEAPAIGLASGFEFPVSSCVINRGEMLLAYTDGVTEAQNMQSEFFTLDRLIGVLENRRFGNAEEVVDTLLDELAAFVQETEPFDDITIVGMIREA